MCYCISVQACSICTNMQVVCWPWTITDRKRSKRHAWKVCTINVSAKLVSLNFNYNVIIGSFSYSLLSYIVLIAQLYIYWLIVSECVLWNWNLKSLNMSNFRGQLYCMLNVWMEVKCYKFDICDSIYSF